jgi:hypothetical protein
MPRRWLALATVALALLLPAVPFVEALAACAAHHAMTAPEEGLPAGSHQDGQCPTHQPSNPPPPLSESTPRLKCGCTGAVTFVVPVAPPTVAFALGVPIEITAAERVAPAEPIVAISHPTTPPPRA